MSFSKVQGRVCVHCGHVDENTHWNDPGKLAPVGTWMYIKLLGGVISVGPDGQPLPTRIYLTETVVIAFRTRHLTEREGLMEYKTLSGDTLLGKFYWTHA